MRKLLALAALAAVAAAPALLGGTAEVFGRPLRGLTPVSVAEVSAHPERYRGRPLRVSGDAAAMQGGRVVLAEGSASLAVESDGSFALPADLKGARVTAEGRLRADAVVLVATGLEVRR